MSRVVGRLLVEEEDRPESCLRGGLQIPLAHVFRVLSTVEFGGGCQDADLTQRRFVRLIGGCAYILGLFGAVVAGVSLRHAR